MKQYYKNPYTPSIDLIELVAKVSFSIDAITLIVEGDNNLKGMLAIFNTYKSKMDEEGFKTSPFNSHGYVGVSIGSVRYGFNHKGEKAMFSITGPESRLAFSELATLEGYATRIDLAATFELSEPVPDLAKLIHEARVYVGSTAGVKLQDYSYISGREGDTLYIGNRQSPKMLRIYDKSYQYLAARGTFWRWEIQYNRDTSRALWIGLDGIENNDYLLENLIARKMFEDCHSKGVRLPIEYGPVDMAELPVFDAKKPDRERYLKWLRETVSPVVKWMTARGEKEMVLEALGIQSIKAQIEEGGNILAVISEFVEENVSRETIRPGLDSMD